MEVGPDAGGLVSANVCTLPDRITGEEFAQQVIADRRSRVVCYQLGPILLWRVGMMDTTGHALRATVSFDFDSQSVRLTMRYVHAIGPAEEDMVACGVSLTFDNSTKPLARLVDDMLEQIATHFTRRYGAAPGLPQFAAERAHLARMLQETL
ncbi:hypothetical protein [Gemmatimonas sp.]